MLTQLGIRDTVADDGGQGQGVVVRYVCVHPVLEILLLALLTPMNG